MFCSQLRSVATRKGFLSLAAKMRRVERDAAASRKLAQGLELLASYEGPAKWRPLQVVLGREDLSNPIAVVWGNVFSLEMTELVETLEISNIVADVKQAKQDLLSLVRGHYVAADDFKVLANNKERALMLALEKSPKTPALGFDVKPVLAQLIERLS